MATELIKIPFTEELLSKVQGFDCGDKPWEREISEWLKGTRGTGSAIDDLDRGNQVWLYVMTGGDIVGVGSLGVTDQRWPRPKDPKIAVSILPMLGVERRFQGQRFGRQIMSDLIAEAKRFETDRPILILYVNEKNTDAIRFYEVFGFRELHKPILDKTTGFTNRRMALVLQDPGA